MQFTGRIQLGRWINRDPLGETAAHNLFMYVYNRPDRKVDLSGLMDFNNCMGWSCGANRTPSTPYGTTIGPAPGSSPGSFFGGFGYTCTKLKQGEQCKCCHDDGKFIAFFFGAPGYAGSTDFMGSPYDAANIGIHTISWNQSGANGQVPGWSQVSQNGWPAEAPPESVQNPYGWQPAQGDGPAQVYGTYCCCKN
jgi:hypothetical protein